MSLEIPRILPRPRGEATAIHDWIDTLLRKTSAHEGQFWSVQRNLDGNGVSYGILQWTQKGGALGTLLAAMAEADPASFARVFGPSWQKLLDVTRRASLEAVDGAVLWADPWLSRFESAGRMDVFQRVQRRVGATGVHMQGAVEIARMLGIWTERAMVLLYNRTVHQGAAGAKRRAQQLLDFYRANPGKRPEAPNDVLAQYAWLCASKFRTTTPPSSSCYNEDCNIKWSAVTSEWSEIGPGRYAIARVTVSNVWHATTGKWSLYDLITKRSSGILLDTSLRDLPVDLDLSRYVG